MTSLRSSTRETPRRRYTVDAFESIHDLLVESGSGSSSGSRSDEDDSLQDEDEGDVFEAGAEPSDADDDSMSGLDELGPLEEVDDRASNEGDFDLDDNISIVDDLDSPTPQKRTRRSLPSKLLTSDGQELFVRGVPDIDLKVHNKEKRRLLFFGPTHEDWGPVFEGSRRWEHEPCLPSRKERHGYGGFEYCASYQKEIESIEANWNWYEADGGKNALRQRQVLNPLSAHEALQYIAVNGTGDRSFVIGPVADQKLYNMKTRQFVVLSEPYKLDPQHPKAQKCNSPTYKSGFVLNLGARVNCLDWAPNQPGSRQYLAVSVLPEQDPTNATTSAPAFTPQEPHKSCIQIWRFGSTPSNYIDKTAAPRLDITICLTAGDVRALKWCPVPRKQSGTLGLLACIFGDGSIQVFDVDLSESRKATSHLLVEKAALEAKPPDTVCTSVTWLTSSRVAVSCANGYLAVWDLSKSTRPETTNPRPEIYTSISTGFIVSISSCYPSFPNKIIATTMAGYLTVTDLTGASPGNAAGTALSSRSRIGTYHIVWHDQSHCGINVEENMSCRALPMRRWFNNIIIGRMKSNATSIAVSPCHPFVLFGCAGGEVVGTNPMRKIITGSKGGTVQQTWFAHEWRRPTEEEKQAARPIEGAMRNGQQEMKAMLGKDGLSRFVDGFKAVSVFLGPGTHPVNTREDGVMLATIHEPKSAVTTLAWNPNIHVGGWVAAGMGDGLLRVEDIAS